MIEEASLRSAANTGSTYNGRTLGFHGTSPDSIPTGITSGNYEWSLPKCKYCKSGHIELKYEGKMVLCLDCKAMSKR